jgi:Ankyrin repeats (3 copies)
MEKISSATTRSTILTEEENLCKIGEHDDVDVVDYTSDEDTYNDEDDDDDDDDDDSDDDYSVGLAFVEEEENRHAEKQSGLFLSLEMVTMLRASTSDGNLNSLVQDESIQKMFPRVNSDGNVMNAFKGNMVHSLQAKAPQFTTTIEEGMKPSDYLLDILKSYGITTTDLTNNNELNSTYVKGCVAGYTLPLTTAIRRCDVDALRALKDSGTQKTFQCSNQFGESIVHAAARQGSLSILQFLFNEANVSCRVRCDTGRTPLHDACWTSGIPKFDSIQFLFEQCPEFLLVRDKRNYTPLDYPSRDTYPAWRSFVDRNKDLMVAALQKYESKNDTNETSLYEF